MDDDGPTTFCLPCRACLVELASWRHMERVPVRWCRRGSFGLSPTSRKTLSDSRSGCARMTTGPPRMHSFAAPNGRARIRRLQPRRLDRSHGRRADQPLDNAHQAGHDEQAPREKNERGNQLETEPQIASDRVRIHVQHAIRPSPCHLDSGRWCTSAAPRFAHRLSLLLQATIRIAL